MPSKVKVKLGTVIMHNAGLHITGGAIGTHKDVDINYS